MLYPAAILTIIIFQAFAVPAVAQLAPISGVVNIYTPVNDYSYCNNTVTVTNGEGFDTGDTVLIIQMKGADIDTTNTPAFGSVKSFMEAGSYEFNYVANRIGNEVRLRNYLHHPYNFETGRIQMIRVPSFQDAAVTGTLTCQPWNGETGGVIAFHVTGTLDLQADISVSGKGFRGGDGNHVRDLTARCGIAGFFYHDSSRMAARKGEGIAGVRINQTKGRAPVVNGGGGGQGYRSGGGGGGNFGRGGRGGWEYMGCDPHLDNSGMSSHQTGFMLSSDRVIMGGGGGAGHATDSVYEPDGGNGGGIIFIKASVLQSNGHIISADGEPGFPVYDQTLPREGMGGGGAGGSIILDIQQYSDRVTLSAEGRDGADFNWVGSWWPYQVAGSGGGGAGGVIRLSNDATPANSVLRIGGGRQGWDYAVFPGPSNGQGAGQPGLVSVIQPPVPDTLFNSLEIQILRENCATFQFEAAGSYPPGTAYSWLIDGMPAGSVSQITHTFSSSGSHIIRLTILTPTGCSQSGETTLEVSFAEIDAGEDQNFCGSDARMVSLHATGNGSIEWAPANLFANTAIANPTISLAGSTTFYVTATVSPVCTATDSMTVFFHPSYTLHENRRVCRGELPLNWNGLTISMPGIYSQVLTSREGCDSSLTLDVTLTDTLRNHVEETICPSQLPYVWNGSEIDSAGTYIQHFISARGCDSTEQIQLHVLPSQIKRITKDVCDGDLPFIWNGISITRSGDYEASFIAQNGCDSLVMLTVSIGESSSIAYQLPGAFTPNGDGLNDCFGLNNRAGVRTLKLSIYNRWGIKIFETADHFHCWDGKYKGQPADPGAYVYYLTGTTSCGDLNKAGNVLLIR